MMTVTLLNRRRLLAALGLSPVVAATPAMAHAPRRDPVRILFTRVNGEHYYEAKASLPTLQVGDAVTLRREPTNAYDRRAVEVFDMAGRKLGYVARVDNSALARMMDAGEQFTARVGRLDESYPCDIRLEIDWHPL